MTTMLLVLLALAAGLVAGVLLGVLLGRQHSAAQREQALARVREELADARVEAAQAQAEVRGAVAERDAATARAHEVEAVRHAMVDQFRLLSNEVAEQQRRAVETTASQRFQATEQALAPVAASLREFQARLTDVEKERAAMATDLRAHVRAVRDTGEALRRETASLVTALRKPQVRGSWGEVQLKRVAELAGMVERCDFDVQLTAHNDGLSLRPDMRVHLAEGKYVFVDSKVPLSAFLDAMETDDAAERTSHLASFAKHVRTHVDQLSAKKYWKVGHSPEFVVLFLPSEAFFVAALEQLPDLHEYAAARDVVLATPTTLIGMLRSISYGWKQAALAETALEVFRLGRELHERLGQMGNRFDKLGRALRSSVNAYNETIATVEGRVLVQARRFRDLKVSEAELDAPQSVDEPVRQIQASELVDDATRVEPLVGRAPRRRTPRSELPEAEALWRSDPDVDELVHDEAKAEDTGSSGQRRSNA
jgi:DNA recombination protein RmuC